MIYFPFDANLGSEKDIKHDKTEVGVKEGTSVFPVLLMWKCFVKFSLTNVYSNSRHQASKKHLTLKVI